jgi:hypothetical protein
MYSRGFTCPVPPQFTSTTDVAADAVAEAVGADVAQAAATALEATIPPSSRARLDDSFMSFPVS